MYSRRNMRFTKCKPLFTLIYLSQLTIHLFAQDSTFYYPVYSLSCGSYQSFSADKFLDTYNNPLAFARPFFLSEKEWEPFEPFQYNYSFALDLGLKFYQRYLLGISFEYQAGDFEDKLVYSGLAGYDESHQPVYFNFTEKYNFETRFIPIIAFFDYRLFTNSIVSPVIGFGAGMAFIKFKWKWHIYGSKVINNTRYYLKEDRIWLNKEEKKFLFQPRLRLELNLIRISEGIGKYFDNVYVQIDYIYCKDKYDFFKEFRNEFLEGYSIDTVPEDMKSLFNDYDVSWGGFHIMFGVTIKRF